MKRNVKMGLDEFLKEHKHLVATLEHGSKGERHEEAKKQYEEEELEEEKSQSEHEEGETLGAEMTERDSSPNHEGEHMPEQATSELKHFIAKHGHPGSKGMEKAGNPAHSWSKHNKKEEEK